MLDNVKKHLRVEHFPHIWCPGCGHGIVTQAFLRAVESLGLDPDKLTVVSGIGCSSRSVGYLNFDTLHTAHGRAIPFATGIKFAKPELSVAILAGDGDIAAIGGNHLIHAARRNIDLTVIVYNNFTYGMTSGQYSPMTPAGNKATTAQFGNLESPFDLCELVKAAGATYVARSTTYHAALLPKLIADAFKNRGFSLVEILSGCPTYYGRMNDSAEPKKMLEWQKNNTVPFNQYKTMSVEERQGKLATGVIHSAQRPEYTEEYLKLIQNIQG